MNMCYFPQLLKGLLEICVSRVLKQVEGFGLALVSAQVSLPKFRFGLSVTFWVWT